MTTNKQEQSAADGAIAIQAGGNIVISNGGLTYAEVRQVALDIYQAKLAELAGAAKEIARNRAQEITEAYLSKLQDEYPEGLQKAEDPDFQHALFTVQKEYARSGDADLGALLVDLLVDRSREDKRDILQIVLNESLNVAPKLTNAQLAVLSTVFLLAYTQSFMVVNHRSLGDYFDKHVKPFADKIVTNQASYQHLQYTGCGSVEITVRSLGAVLGSVYQGQFMKGFEIQEVEKRNFSSVDARFFIPCLNDPSKLQINANSMEALSRMFDAHAVPQSDRAKIVELFNQGKMDDGEIRNKCQEIRPYMAGVFEKWSGSPMQSFTLTSVGIAIAHANIKRLIGEFADLRIWIN